MFKKANLVRCSLHNVDAVVVHPQHLTRNLNHLCVQSLTHFTPAMGHQDRTVLVNFYQCATLVKKVTKPNRELGGNYGDSTLLPAMGLVKFCYFLGLFIISKYKTHKL